MDCFFPQWAWWYSKQVSHKICCNSIWTDSALTFGDVTWPSKSRSYRARRFLWLGNLMCFSSGAGLFLCWRLWDVAVGCGTFRQERKFASPFLRRPQTHKPGPVNLERFGAIMFFSRLDMELGHFSSVSLFFCLFLGLGTSVNSTSQLSAAQTKTPAVILETLVAFAPSHPLPFLQ